jgi:hypothetical protein
MIDILADILVKYFGKNVWPLPGPCLFICRLSSKYLQVFKHDLFRIYLESMLKESSLSSRWNTEDMDAYERNNI